LWRTRRAERIRYDVRDLEGRLWSVKLGKKSQSDETASRIRWTVGFHQHRRYYLERWTFPDDREGAASGARRNVRNAYLMSRI
jgi:SPX domain protein involved in polyphosphate accumulation